MHAFVDVESNALIQLNDCTCLGYTQTFECNVFGAGITIWQGTAFDCQRNEIRLRHSQYINSQATGECNGGTVVARSVGFTENCYTSQLSVAIGQEIVNDTIECIYIDTQDVSTIVGQKKISITQGK